MVSCTYHVKTKHTFFVELKVVLLGGGKISLHLIIWLPTMRLDYTQLVLKTLEILGLLKLVCATTITVCDRTDAARLLSKEPIQNMPSMSSMATGLASDDCIVDGV